MTENQLSQPTVLTLLEKSPAIKQSIASVPRMVSGNGFFLLAKLLPVTVNWE